ncbi:MAG: helix-turn-helix domain-containing protein [Actinobacteria bacterium]|nr:helix-turn-helix domain-containing protein [Actinomycetota bacterium]
MSSRFLTLADVSETLNISAAQAYALVRCGDLPAIKVGGRGQWRIEAAELENYISRMYAQTREFVATHPFGTEPGISADQSSSPDALHG